MDFGVIENNVIISLRKKKGWDVSEIDKKRKERGESNVAINLKNIPNLKLTFSKNKLD